MNKIIDLATKEMIREEMLEICQQSAPVGADEKVIKAVLRKNGHDLEEQEVIRQLYYLAEKKLLELQTVENRTLQIKRLIARITPEGIDCLEGTTQVLGIGE